MMLHTEFMEAFGTLVQHLGAKAVSERIGASQPQIHDSLVLRKVIPLEAIENLGYRRVPIYIRPEASPVPMDCATKANNFRRAY